MSARVSRRVVVEADGGSRGNPGPAGYGAVVRDAETGEVLAEAAGGIGVATNNVAEYRGLLAGLEAAAGVPDVGPVDVRMDSKLVVEQMSGRWQVKHPDMKVLRKQAAALVERLPEVTFRHVPRAQNAYADRLANEAMDAAARGETWVRALPERGTLWTPTDTPPTSLLLVRHAQTALSVDRRFSGTGDPPLTQLGQGQAAAVAQRIALLAKSLPVVAILTSPLGRARSTATAIAEALGDVSVRVDERLRETNFGDWEGSTFAEVQQRWPDALAAWLADPSVAPPGGEAFVDVERRVLAARDEILAAHPGDAVVVVSHVTPIKMLLRAALEAPPSALYRLHLDLASLSQADWHADGPAVVRRINDTGHLVDGGPQDM